MPIRISLLSRSGDVVLIERHSESPTVVKFAGETPQGKGGNIFEAMEDLAKQYEKLATTIRASKLGNVF